MKKNLVDAFDHTFEIPYKGIEALLVNEVPIERQWQLLEDIKISNEKWDEYIPQSKPSDNEVTALTFRILKDSKGDGTAGLLIDLCLYNELPKSITDFLKTIYSDFPRPTLVPLPKFENSGGQQILGL